jgi:hypothetical protein
MDGADPASHEIPSHEMPSRETPGPAHSESGNSENANCPCCEPGADCLAACSAVLALTPTVFPDPFVLRSGRIVLPVKLQHTLSHFPPTPPPIV